MALAATFRLLYSGEAAFERKLEAAEQLVTALLGAVGEAAALPPLVRTHYLHSLLDWSSGILTRGNTGGGAGKKGKKKQRESGGAGGTEAQQQEQQPARLQPRCWAVLVAVLGSSCGAAGQPVPEGLLPAATVALQLLAGVPERDARHELLVQLAALLRLLSAKFGASYRPSIEHAAAAVEAALVGHAAAARASSDEAAHWQPVAAAAAQLLLAAASGHPNQRKVWDAAVPRLLPLLARAAFPAGASASGGDSNGDALASSCRQLLEAVVFSQAHVTALATAAAAEMAAALFEATGGAAGASGEAAAEAATDMAVEGDGGEEGEPASKQQRSAGYAAQLFAAVQEQAAGGELPPALLPWMAGRFCGALKQYRRAAETEAELTGQAGRRSQQQQDDEGGEEGTAASERTASAGAGGRSGLSVSADFHFWVALLRALLPRVQQLQGQQAEAASTQLAEAVSGVALLAGALRRHQLYRPTQDPAGHQRALLQQLVDVALQLAQAQQAQQAPAGSEGVLPAALGVLQGILDVEHRAIQQQLPLLWPLLLWPAAAAASPNDSGGVAAAVACSLVAVFAELRQLEVLLLSLTAVLQQPPAGTAPTAAMRVLHSSSFQAALATAVRQLPSGQVAIVLRLAAASVPQLGGGMGLLLADLYCTCLARLQVDISTAVMAATAAAAVVAALAPLLLPLLTEAAAGGSDKEGAKLQKQQEQQPALLTALLLLYRQALAVHARCAALHPEVTPLAGQQAKPKAGQPAAAGYFAPLQQQQQQEEGGSGDSALPGLLELLAATAPDSEGPDLRQALMRAAEQRLLMLHQQQRYLARTCPITLLPEPGAEPSDQELEQQAQAQAQQQQQGQLEEVEGELRQLATTLVEAAGEEAAAPGNAGGSSSGATLQLAASSLAVLQEWAAPMQLQQLLQACLHQAASSGSGGSGAARWCRLLLLGGELLEQRQLAALLPAAAAAVLGATLSVALNEGAAEEGSSAKKKSKKAKQQGKYECGSGSDHVAALLQQLERLAEGKEMENSSWAAAVEDSSVSVALAAVAYSGGGSGSSTKKKRKQPDAAGGSSRLQQQVELLAQLPLGHLPAEAAASMAAVAIGSLLCCCEGGLAAQASNMLPAAVACMHLLARLADSTSGSGNSGLISQQRLLPGVLQAALAAACGSGSSPQVLQLVAAAAGHSSRAMQAVCSAQLDTLDSSSLQHTARHLSGQLSRQQGLQQWAAAVLVQACLAACHAAVSGSSSSSRTADILCGGPGNADTQHQDAAAALIGSTAAQLEAAVAAALPPAAASLGADDSGLPALLAGSLYRSAALLLRLRCCDHPAAGALEQQVGSSSSGSAVNTMSAGLQAAAAQLTQPPSAQPEASLLAPALLEYVGACCCVAGHMRPAASNSHYSSLLALLLHLLAQKPADVAGAPPPMRQTIPFVAAFPAAAAAVAAAAQQSNGSSSTVRPQLLDALRELIAGSSSQQLLLPLRYAEAALPASGANMALPLCELLLVLLEAASGSRQQRLLGQHSERIALLLTGFISSTAYAAGPGRQQEPLPSLQQLAVAILAAGEGGSGATAAVPFEQAEQPAAAAAASPPAAEVVALCTAFRALESLAARPKLFALPPPAASSTLASIAAVWNAYAERQTAAGTAEPPALPGFRFRLGTSSGAGLFAGSCHLLLVLLRHRQQELRRCLPLMLQALHALLRFLAAAELSARLQQLLPAGAATPGRRQELEEQWRIKCAELLAAVMAELAGLKDAGIGRYCPLLLADYLLLAAAPPTGKSKALLHYCSPTAAIAASPVAGGSASADAIAAAAAAAAAVAEEDVLAGEPLSPESAAALRQGAYALYGACSAAEIQFLYASLGDAGSGRGQRGGGAAAASWRAALAALKSDYEKHYKYTGKV